MQSSATTTTDSGDDHLVQPLRVAQLKNDDDVGVWQPFVSFQAASQVEAVQRRQWGAFGSKMVDGLQRSLQSSQSYVKTVSSLMESMMQVSQMQTNVTLESNIRSEWVSEAPLDPEVLDQLELDNFMAIDRHLALACRYFGIATLPPENKAVTSSWLRKHIDDNVARLLECLKHLDPLWATKMNQCAQDVQTARKIENLLIEVGDAHRGTSQANDQWKKCYDQYFQTVDNLEKTITWIYNADQAAIARRRPSSAVGGGKSPTTKLEEELLTQLKWFYMAALDYARERRRFVELCCTHLDIANEVRQQRYDPENVVIKYKKRPSYNSGLPELASRLFSAYWDEQVERFTQLRIVSDEAKRLADAWKRENKKYATLAAECDQLCQLPEAKKKALDKLSDLLDSNRLAGRDLISCLESIVPTLRQVTGKLKEQGADREKAKAEAMKKGAAAAFDPALEDPVLIEIERKERRLEESLLRCQDAKLCRAECLEGLRHHLCHREKERDGLKKNCDDLEAELEHINDEVANVTRENDRMKAAFGRSATDPDKGAAQLSEDIEVFNLVEMTKLELINRKRLVDSLRLQAANLTLKIQCVRHQKAILEAACDEKAKTIREFEKHARDTKKAIEDRRKADEADQNQQAVVVSPVPGRRRRRRKTEKLRKQIEEYSEVLRTLLIDADSSMHKHSDISANNLRKMEEHRNWCYKNICKEMELQWNQVQLRKIMCEKGIGDSRQVSSVLVVECGSTGGYSKQPPPQSPVILYHELSTPARERMERHRMPPLTYANYVTRTAKDDKKNNLFIREAISYSHSLSIGRDSERLQWKTQLNERGQPTLSSAPGPSGVNKDNKGAPSTPQTCTISINTEVAKDLKTPPTTPFSSPPTSGTDRSPKQ